MKITPDLLLKSKINTPTKFMNKREKNAEREQETKKQPFSGLLSKLRVEYGARTHDLLNHNQAL